MTIKIKGTPQGLQLEPAEAMIAKIRTEFPIAANPVNLWINDANYADVSDDGPEFAMYQRADVPTIIVAAGDLFPEQVAGLIAQQYARHIQAETGLEDDRQEAANFARYLAGDDIYRPDHLIKAYEIVFSTRGE